MVNTAENDSLEVPDVKVDLGSLKGNPIAEQAAAVFIASLQGGAHTQNGFGRRLNTVVTHDAPAERKDSGYGNYDHSPSGAYERQDQMSYGGTGKGGNWLSE